MQERAFTLLCGRHRYRVVIDLLELARIADMARASKGKRCKRSAIVVTVVKEVHRS